MTDDSLVLIGFGGHAVSVISAAISTGINIKGYVDFEKSTTNPFKLSYLGSDEEYLKNPLKASSHFCVIGHNQTRSKVQQLYEKSNLVFGSIKHATAWIEPTVVLGKGVFIGANAYINGLAKIGDGAIINSHVNIEHGCVLGKFSHIGPHSCLAGDVVVGKETFVGTGCTIIPGIRIGKSVLIGAGSLVINDISDLTKVFGSPAKPR